jgi:transcriptional regulator with XRE-family HTH domain
MEAASMDETDRPIGERIAIYRRRRGISQAVLAGLVGRSESWLSQVERGARSVDRLSVLIDMAKVLKVDVAMLTGQPFKLGPNGSPELDETDAIRKAILEYHDPGDEHRPERDLLSIEQAVHDAQVLYQQAHYARVGSLAPLLIRQAEVASKGSRGDDERQAFAVLAMTYNLVTALLSRTGDTELGWITADRAIAAAQRAEDPELIAVGMYRLGHVMTRAGRVEEAHSIATAAPASTGIASSSTPGAISLRGSLALIAAISAARRDDRREVLVLLRHATQLADELGEDRNDHWTAFGPSNVRIHATSAAVELGDPNDALINGETVDVDALAPGLLGRRSQVHIDRAWAYGQHRNDPATVLSLLEAERIAPEAIRFNVVARELLRECLKRERRTATPGLRGLATRVGVLT